MRSEMPEAAIPISERRPPAFTKVQAWLSWPDVAIENFPAVVWNATASGNYWWSGVPGNYINLGDGSAITHWLPLTPNA